MLPKCFAAPMLMVGVFVMGACGGSSSDQAGSTTGGQSGSTSVGGNAGSTGLGGTGASMGGNAGSTGLGGTGASTSGTGGVGGSGPREPCLRPVGSYRSNPGPASSSNPDYTCTNPGVSLAFFADMPEDRSIPIGEYTCAFVQTQYSVDNCDRLEVITCTDGSSIEVDCTSDPAADLLQCQARSDLAVTVCTNSVTFTRTNCPEWALQEDGSCRQCESDMICPMGQECFGGACLTPCESSVDCDSGLECIPLGYCDVEPVG